MDVRDLVVEVRDINLNRVGQIAMHNLPGLKIAQRFNNVGTWEITLPADDPIADELRAAGAGIIVTGETGVLMSGYTTSAVKEVSPNDPVGIWTIQGVDDAVILGERLAYPTPGTADVEAQTTESDARSGFASTVMYGYVDANIGPSAPAEREIPFLSLAADVGLGSTVFKTARFKVLGEVLSEIGSIDPIGFQIKQSGDLLEFSCYEPTDRTSEIRLDVVNDTLSKSTYGYGVPSVTRAIVGGTGQGTSRTFLEVSDTESLAAETLWNRRIETFVDQNNEADPDVLNQAGLETIADGGRTMTSVSVLPSSDLTMTYGRDWYLGDRVTVVVGDQEVSATVTETAITVGSDGIRIGATVGDPSGVDFDALITRRESTTPKRLNAVELKEGGSGGSVTGGLPVGGTAGQILSKIDSTNYNAEWSDNYALWTSQLKHEVKAGEALTKGQAVYVSSANGTNIIVSKASNATEETSSKTMGLIASTLAHNGKGFVITEGLLAGLNTSTATAGDPVWLGTAGNLIYGLANEPVAPAHLVFIGIVTRANPSNGEIFIRPQNGFQLRELHDVLIVSVADNNVLAYDSASGLWKNQTAAEAGVVATVGATITNPTIVNAQFNGVLNTQGANVSAYIDIGGDNNEVTPALTVTANEDIDGSYPIARFNNSDGTQVGGINESGHIDAPEFTRSGTPVPRVYSQATQPGGGNIGDIWIDTDSAQNVVGAVPRFDTIRTATQSVGNNTTTVVTYSTITENTGGFVSSSGAVTVPLTGRYSITGQISWALNGTGYRQIQITQNGTAIWGNLISGSIAASTNDSGVAVTSERLTANDVIRIQGTQNSGGALNITSARLILEYLGA
jgi:hypothetical protein